MSVRIASDRFSRPAHTPADPASANPVEPLHTLEDFARILSVGRRTAGRMRAAGKLPRPDLHVGRMPRWKAETIRGWIEGQAAGN